MTGASGGLSERSRKRRGAPRITPDPARAENRSGRGRLRSRRRGRPPGPVRAVRSGPERPGIQETVPRTGRRHHTPRTERTTCHAVSRVRRNVSLSLRTGDDSSFGADHSSGSTRRASTERCVAASPASASATPTPTSSRGRLPEGTDTATGAPQAGTRRRRPAPPGRGRRAPRGGPRRRRPPSRHQGRRRRPGPR